MAGRLLIRRRSGNTGEILARLDGGVVVSKVEEEANVDWEWNSHWKSSRANCRPEGVIPLMVSLAWSMTKNSMTWVSWGKDVSDTCMGMIGLLPGHTVMGRM